MVVAKQRCFATCAFLVLSSIISVTVACYCSGDWKCEDQQKTVMTGSCDTYTRWYLKGNRLREIPARTNAMTYGILDMKDNELGLGDMKFNFNFFLPLTSLDVSRNFLPDMKFLKNGAGNTSTKCGIESLYADGNYISSLSDITFCSDLTILNITDNNITSIPELNFRKMKQINLSGNPIAFIESRALEAMYQSLVSFSMSRTKVLEELPENMFSNFTRLENIFLDGNKLQNLPESIFHDLSKLKKLFLKSNELQALLPGIFTTNINLEILDLQRNQLRYLPENVFDNLLKLRSLDLDNNFLQELSPETFAHLHSLKELSVRNNHLKAIPSLHKCSAPVESVLFNNNNISEVAEPAVRALLRYGFQLGDLSGNPLKNSTEWWKNASDVTYTTRETIEQICTKISLFYVDGHGSVSFCFDRF